MNSLRIPRLLSSLACCALLAACAGSSPQGGGAAGASGGSYKVGKPYQINGQWYYPREDYNYDESGIASWYGADFHDQATANGEIYNKNELTAAHKTLPLPTLARVTNLENGRSIVVRINDRGPFSGARVIDMSQRAAQLLGFEAQGTAKVRVQVLADESKAIADAMRRYGKPMETAEAGATGVQAAPLSAVSSVPLDAPASSSPPPSSVEQGKTLQPIRSTPETRRALIDTRPLPVAVQLPVTGGSRIFVQAGSFTVAENADKLSASMKKFGASSVSTAVVNGTTFYRVRLGPVADVAKADALLSQVKKAGASGARTVVD